MYRFFLHIILFLYLLPAAGVSIEAHYCGGKIESFSFFCWQDDDCCCKSSTRTLSGCCENRQAVFRFAGDQQCPHSIRIQPPAPAALAELPNPPFLHLGNPVHLTHESLPFPFQSNAPPLFLHYSQFLI
jgi:hypothetical protein